MLLPLKRYADFSGRSRRKEYWMFFLFQFLINIILLVLFFAFVFWSVSSFDEASNSTAGIIMFAGVAILYLIFCIAMLIPNMAVVVRRLHDQDIPGIVGILLYIATIIFAFPGIVILILMCLEGQKGDNQYGEDPKLNENVHDVFS